MELQTSNRFEVLRSDVEMHRSQNEVSHGRDPAKKQDETETWCTRVTKRRSLRFRDTQLIQDRAPPVSRKSTWRGDGEPKVVQEAASEAGLGNVAFDSVWQHFMEAAQDRRYC